MKTNVQRMLKNKGLVRKGSELRNSSYSIKNWSKKFI